MCGTDPRKREHPRDEEGRPLEGHPLAEELAPGEEALLDDAQRELLLYSSGELDEAAAARLEERLAGEDASGLRCDAEMLVLLELGLGSTFQDLDLDRRRPRSEASGQRPRNSLQTRPADDPRAVNPAEGAVDRDPCPQRPRLDRRSAPLPRWGLGLCGLLAAAALLFLLNSLGVDGDPDSDPVAEPSVVGALESPSVHPALSTSSQRLLRELRSERGPLIRPSFLAASTRATPVAPPRLPARSRLRDKNPSLDAFLSLRSSR